jgi:SPP1 family holin
MKLDKASIIRMTAAVLAALKLILTPFGIDIEQDTIDATVDFIAAVVVVWAAWKNEYISRKGLAQKDQLKKAGLL